MSAYKGRYSSCCSGTKEQQSISIVVIYRSELDPLRVCGGARDWHCLSKISTSIAEHVSLNEMPQPFDHLRSILLQQNQGVLTYKRHQTEKPKIRQQERQLHTVFSNKKLFILWQVRFRFGFVSRRPLPSWTMMYKMVACSYKLQNKCSAIDEVEWFTACCTSINSIFTITPWLNVVQ